MASLTEISADVREAVVHQRRVRDDDALYRFTLIVYFILITNSVVSVSSHDGATSLDTKAKPEVARRPSDNCPPVVSQAKRSSQSDVTGDKSPSEPDSSAVIYSVPFSRPTVAYKKSTATTETANLQGFPETSQAQKSAQAVKSSTGVDAGTFQEYSEVWTSPSLPSLSSGSQSPEYVDVDSLRKSPANGNPMSQATSYEYADPNAVGKWSLQHIARGKPVECEYATLPDEAGRGAYSPVELQPGQLTLLCAH